MAEDIAISVNDVSKMYKLYDNPMDRLKESLGLSRKKKYKEHYALNHVSFQVHKGETEKKWDGYHIFEEAKKGDKLCLLAIDEMVDILGEGIANICYVINPEVVVLGGGIMAQEQFLKERVECAVKRYLVSSIEEHTKIVFAKHQNDAGMLGAFYHFCSLH